jgi:hypothetical protein
MAKPLKFGKYADPGFTGGLCEQHRDGLVTHVVTPDQEMHPLRPEDRAPNTELSGKQWTLDDEGYAVPVDPPEEPEPEPEEEPRAPGSRTTAPPPRSRRPGRPARVRTARTAAPARRRK